MQNTRQKNVRSSRKQWTDCKRKLWEPKGLSAIQQAVNTRLSMDIAIQKQIPTSIIAVDLTACYDRISHAVASLCMQRLGHKLSTVVCRFSTVQNLDVNVRMAFGDSKTTNNDEIFACQLNNPPQGVLQGSTDGPVLWAIVSSPVLEILRELGYETIYKCSISREKVEYMGCLFMDDAVYVLNTERRDEEHTLEKTQEMQDKLQGLMKATGGMVNPEKCFGWTIGFKWTKGTWRLKKKDQIK